MKIYIHANFAPYEKEMVVDCYHLNRLITTKHLEVIPSNFENEEVNNPTYFNRVVTESRFGQEKVNKLEDPTPQRLVRGVIKIDGVTTIILHEYCFFVEMGLAFDHDLIRKKIIGVVMEAFLITLRDLEVKIRVDEEESFESVECFAAEGHTNDSPNIDLRLNAKSASPKKRTWMLRQK